MAELFTKLGVNWMSLVFQIINFAVLLYILHRFVYKPILKVLEDRKNKVAKSIEQAEETKKVLEHATEEREQILLKARKEAQAIIERINQEAQKMRDEKIEQTKQEIATLVSKSKEQIVREREQAIGAVRKEASELVVLATEKVLRERLKEREDADLVRRSVQELLAKQ